MLPPVLGVLFDGLAYGMLLFLLSVGLSVTLGLMNFVNLAHCAFAMLGGYVTVVLMKDLHWNFFATLPLAFFAAALVSVVIERILYRRLYRASDLDQVLLTIGLAFISVAVAAWFFGTTQQPIDMPSYMRGSFVVMGLNIAVYRLFLVAVGIVVTVLLIMTLEHTRFGAQGARGGRQPAHGARAWHRRRPHLRHHLRARLGIGGPGRRAGDRDRRARSEISPSPISSMC